MKHKLFLSTVACTLSSVALIPPIYNMYSYYQNEAKTSHIKTEKETQIENFKLIDINKIDDIIDTNIFNGCINNENIHYNNHKISTAKSNAAYQDISAPKYANEIKNFSREIINGEILISDLQKKYNEEIKECSPDSNSFLAFSNQNHMSNLYSNNISNITDSLKSFSENPLYYSQDIQNHEDDILTISNIGFLTKISDIVDNLQNFINSLNNVYYTSIALTVVAWAVSAYYWFAWWMFGANVPFALAATLQASLLTVTTAETSRLIGIVQTDLSIFRSVDNQINAKQRNDIEQIYNDYKNGKISANMAISLCKGLAQFTGINRAIKWCILKLGNKLLAKSTSYLLSNYSNIFNAKIAANKWPLLSTSWVNAISIAITIIDFSLSLTSFILILSYNLHKI